MDTFLVRTLLVPSHGRPARPLELVAIEADHGPPGEARASARSGSGEVIARGRRGRGLPQPPQP